MWQKIADKLQNLLKIKVSPSQCENRWRVLERGYKKYVDDQSSTGRGKNFYEYEEEMNCILGKKNVFPELLLEADTLVNEPLCSKNINIIEKENINRANESEKRSIGSAEIKIVSTQNRKLRKRRSTVLETMSNQKKKNIMMRDLQSRKKKLNK